ncbi:MAG TPA: hypothetical protein PLG59_02300 [bacterium]|nr:hypothetical protein [bacterium]
MNATAWYKKTLSDGALVLLIAMVFAYWGATASIRHSLREIGYPRLSPFLGHEEWLDESGMFAVHEREKWTWGAMLLVLAAVKVFRAYRTGYSSIGADGVCAGLGTVLGPVLAVAGFMLIYGSKLILCREVLIPGGLFSLCGLPAGLLIAGLAAWIARRSARASSNIIEP